MASCGQKHNPNQKMNAGWIKYCVDAPLTLCAGGLRELMTSATVKNKDMIKYGNIELAMAKSQCKYLDSIYRTAFNSYPPLALYSGSHTYCIFMRIFILRRTLPLSHILMVSEWLKSTRTISYPDSKLSWRMPTSHVNLSNVCYDGVTTIRKSRHRNPIIRKSAFIKSYLQQWFLLIQFHSHSQPLHTNNIM